MIGFPYWRENLWSSIGRDVGENLIVGVTLSSRSSYQGFDVENTRNCCVFVAQVVEIAAHDEF